MLRAVMNTTFFFALVLSVANIVLSLVFFFLGYQTDKITQGQWVSLFLPLVVMIVVNWLGIKAVREEAKDNSLSYGKGVGTGFLITLYAALIGIFYTFIHLQFINPNFADYAIDAVRQKWVAAGMGDSQMEQTEKFMRFIYKPAIMAIMGFIMSLVGGLVVSLILSIFLRRKPAAPVEDAPPAV